MYSDLIRYNPDHLQQYGENIVDEAVWEKLDNPPFVRQWRLGIWHKDANATEHVMVGSTRLTDLGDGHAAMGWWIGAEHIGHRYAARAARMILRYVFERSNLTMVVADIHKDNLASVRTAELAGFTRASVDSEGRAILAISRHARITV
jgi:RimJ/RimL family protein N-acetyltransferase